MGMSGDFHSYQDPRLQPPDEPELGDEECDVEGCLSVALLDQELCDEHMREHAEEERAERAIEQRWAEAYGNNTGEQYE